MNVFKIDCLEPPFLSQHCIYVIISNLVSEPLTTLTLGEDCTAVRSYLHQYKIIHL